MCSRVKHSSGVHKFYFQSLLHHLCVCAFVFQAMVGILQGKARGGEEESILMHDLKPFRILISLLDKPELGNNL